MELKNAFKKLNDNKQFKDFNRKNKNFYLSFALMMLEDNIQGPWQLGFYLKSSDKMITFVVDKTEIKMEGEEEIFKKPETEVKEVDIEKVKIEYGEVLNIAEKFKKSEYPRELVNKVFLILQNLEDYGVVWNLTFVMHSFNTLNIKINAENGRIIHHTLESLMNFVKK